MKMGRFKTHFRNAIYNKIYWAGSHLIFFLSMFVNGSLIPCKDLWKGGKENFFRIQWAGFRFYLAQNNNQSREAEIIIRVRRNPTTSSCDPVNH